MAPPPGRLGGTVKLPVQVRMFSEEIAAVDAFAEELSQQSYGAAFSRAEALRIAHIPPNLVVGPWASHTTLDITTRYPHHVSSSPTAICMEMRHGTKCQTDTPQPHHHRRFPR